MSAWHWIASGFGAGYAPKAPGTAGSLVGLFIGTLLLTAGHLPLVFAIIIVTALGIFAIQRVDNGGADPGWIVIDEIAGQMIGMLTLATLTPLSLLVSFALFRLFDIWKPGPVAWADRRHDAYGVMGDDVIAGLMAAVSVLALEMVIPL